MGWFQKKQPQEPGVETEKPSPARNPDNVFMFRMVAVAYVLYTVWKTIKLYLAGGEDAPRLWMLCLSTVLLGGGAIVLAVISFRRSQKRHIIIFLIRYTPSGICSPGRGQPTWRTQRSFRQWDFGSLSGSSMTGAWESIRCITKTEDYKNAAVNQMVYRSVFLR